MVDIRPADPAGSRPWLVVALCLLVAIVEGIDIQSVGVAAPGIARTYQLGSGGLGVVMSSSILGLMIGAAVGGWASDYVGRKPILIVSMVVLGFFTLATTFAPSTGYLLGARFLAGIGLGGAFPTLITLISESVPERYRGTGLGAMYCGLPIGGAVAAMTMAGRPPQEWTAVFTIGGWAPLLLTPLLAIFLPAAPVPASQLAFVDRTNRDKAAGGLFGPRAASTLLLWTSFFFTLLVVYTLLNWLPSLMLARGFERSAALHLSMAMNLGAAAGGIATGVALDRVPLGKVAGLVYVGMVVSLAVLVASSGAALYGATFAVGWFVIGGQLVLYAIAPRLYPSPLRGRGVGAAVSIGRAGSITGPALAGAMLAAGVGASTIPLVLAGGLVVALMASQVLIRTSTLAVEDLMDSGAAA